MSLSIFLPYTCTLLLKKSLGKDHLLLAGSRPAFPFLNRLGRLSPLSSECESGSKKIFFLCVLVFLHSCSLVVKEPKIFDTTLCCSVPPTLKKKRSENEQWCLLVLLLLLLLGVLDFCAKCVPFSCKASLLSFCVFLQSKNCLAFPLASRLQADSSNSTIQYTEFENHWKSHIWAQSSQLSLCKKSMRTNFKHCVPHLL